MARGIEGNEVSTPRPPTLKKSPSSSQPEKSQKTLLGFFQKKSSQTPPTVSQSSNASSTNAGDRPKSKSRKNAAPSNSNANLTPAPSSDAPELPSPEMKLSHHDKNGATEDQENGLPSPITPAKTKADVISRKDLVTSSYYSPSRKASQQGEH